MKKNLFKPAHILLLIIALGFLSACASYKYSNKRKGETIKITFTASWTGSNSDINSKQEIGNFYLELRDIPLGDTEKFEEYKKDIIGMPVYGSSFIVPRSYGTYLNERKVFEPAYGQGIYDILVEITESGKDHFVTKIVQDNSGKIVEEVKSTLINQLR